MLKSIELLVEIPPLTRFEGTGNGDGGYRYSDKYIGKLFRYKDKYILFSETSYEDYSKQMIDAISIAIFSEIKAGYMSVESFDTYVDSSKKQIHDLNNLINEQNTEFMAQIDVLSKALKILKNNNVVDAIIDEKLKVVYDNFNNVVSKIVSEKVTEAMANSNRSQSGNLKLSTIMMLREMGISPTEIKTFSDAGLI